MSKKIKLFLVIFLIIIGGCSSDAGGAIEIAWVIRGLDQHAYTCKEPGFEIEHIKLSIVPINDKRQDLCEEGIINQCVFICPPDKSSTMRGMTSFSIPPGQYYVRLIPLDKNDSPVDSSIIQTPYPVLITVKKDVALFLGVWQLIINKR